MPSTEKSRPAKTEKSPKPRRHWTHWVAVAGCVLGSLIVIAEAGYLWLDQAYQQTITPGVRIGQVSVGGQSYLQALERFQQYAKDVETNGLTFSANGKEVAVTPSALATPDPDLAVSLISFDPEQSVDAAYAIGRSGDFWHDLKAKARALANGTTVQMSYELDDARITTRLQEAFLDFAKPAQDAAIIATGKDLTVKTEKAGEKLDYLAGLISARNQLEAFANPVRVALNTIPDEPSVTAVELQPLLADAEVVLERGPVKLEMPDQIETIDPDQIASWLIGKRQNGQAVLGFGLPALDEFFTGVAERVDILPAEGRYEIRDGKLFELTPGKPGRALDRSATMAAMEAAYLRQGATTAVAVMSEQQPELTEADLAQLGALELLGTGYSNFNGSPNNRRHNIATGSAALHGLVIPPDKEFSLGEALGPIEKETGYLPELVIKGDKTIPEYGGGLCQVGTTAFRAAMAAGLPITERRNHSYNVSYYLENGLPGTDATIYPPHPDLRFVNDTGQFILIQVRSAGNDLYYDFWGKPDGRTMERTAPRVWDRVSPPPTKEIETADLAPGVRKCTERAHTGLKAEFTYTVHYANGETKEQVFRSTYKPWPEVCLVGKAV